MATTVFAPQHPPSRNKCAGAPPVRGTPTKRACDDEGESSYAPRIWMIPLIIKEGNRFKGICLDSPWAAEITEVSGSTSGIPPFAGVIEKCGRYTFPACPRNTTAVMLIGPVDPFHGKKPKLLTTGTMPFRALNGASHIHKKGNADLRGLTPPIALSGGARGAAEMGAPLGCS